MYLLNTRFPVVVLFCSRRFQDWQRITLVSLETPMETFLNVALTVTRWRTTVFFELREVAQPIDELCLIEYVVKEENNNINRSIINNPLKELRNGLCILKSLNFSCSWFFAHVNLLHSQPYLFFYVLSLSLSILNYNFQFSSIERQFSKYGDS